MDFTDAIDRVLANEGGYVNNPADPGGETNFGISKHSYPDVDIAGLTRDGAKAIYKRDFWDQVDGDNLPPAIAYQLLDFAVNGGIGTAIRKAQQAVGVADDGRWGPITRAAVAAMDPRRFALKFGALKITYYTKLSTFGAFGAGWMNRVAADLEFAAEDQ